MAGKAHLANQAFGLGPSQEFGAWSIQSPGEVVSTVEAMDGQGGELLDSKPLEDRAQLPLAAG